MNNPRLGALAIAAGMACLTGEVSRADHVPDAGANGWFWQQAEAAYQSDASRKRYADIFRIAMLIEDHVRAKGEVPRLDPGAGQDTGGGEGFEVAVLGQQAAVDSVFRNGTPFGFSLTKFRAVSLLQALEQGLGRDVRLPLDPQKIGTNFAPVYFVFLQHTREGGPGRYIVLGTFAQPVALSTEVAEGVHLVGFSNRSDLPFVVPVHDPKELAPGLTEHILDQGKAADEVFRDLVPIATD